MGKAIVIGSVLIVVLLILGGFYVWTLKHDNEGDLTRAEEEKLKQLARDASLVMGSLGAGPTLDDMDVLRPVTRTAVDKWLSRYRDFRKEIS